MQISVVIPIYNEEKNIPLLYERLHQALHDSFSTYEVIWVDDGSADNSLSIIKEICSKNKQHHFVSLSRNFGHQQAIAAGLDFASGESIVMMDGDLQDPPELIPLLYEKIQEGYDVVYATRKKRKGEDLFKIWTAKIFYRILFWVSSIKIPVDTGDFRIINRKVLKALHLMPERSKFLRGQIAWLGFKQTAIYFDRSVRVAGKSKYTLAKMLQLAWNGLTAFSNFPLQIASWMGFLFSFVAFCIMLYALYSKFILQQVVTGWTSLMVSTMFIGGIQLLCIGIIGEYLSRIANDARNRPPYIINETNIQKPDN